MKEDKRNIYLFGGSSFLNDMGSEMVFPLLPFFVQSIGGTGFLIGLISGLREGLSSIFKLLGGWISDRIGRRKELVFIGYLISGITKFFISISKTPSFLASFVSLERLGKVRESPRDVILMNSVSNRGHWYGFLQSIDNAGGLVGTILIIILIYFLNFDFRKIALIAAIVSICSIIPIIFIKDLKLAKVKTNLFESIKNVNSDIKRIITVFALYAIADFWIISFILIKLNNHIDNIVKTLLVYSIFFVVVVIFSKYMGNLSDKVGRKKIISIGYSLFVIISLGLAFSNSFWLTSLLLILYGMVYALTNPAQKAFVADFAKHDQGTSIGLYHFSIGTAMVIGGLIAGLIWDKSPTIMFSYMAILASIVTFILIRYTKEI